MNFLKIKGDLLINMERVEAIKLVEPQANQLAIRFDASGEQYFSEDFASRAEVQEYLNGLGINWKIVEDVDDSNSESA